MMMTRRSPAEETHDDQLQREGGMKIWLVWGGNSVLVLVMIGRG